MLLKDYIIEYSDISAHMINDLCNLPDNISDNIKSTTQIQLDSYKKYFDYKLIAKKTYSRIQYSKGNKYGSGGIPYVTTETIQQNKIDIYNNIELHNINNIKDNIQKIFSTNCFDLELHGKIVKIISMHRLVYLITKYMNKCFLYCASPYNNYIKLFYFKNNFNENDYKETSESGLSCFKDNVTVDINTLNNCYDFIFDYINRKSNEFPKIKSCTYGRSFTPDK